MSEEKSNVVELGNTVNESEAAKKPKSEWEQMLESMMQRAYLQGLSTGMKTMCGSVLSKMNEFHNKKMNPQMQIMQLQKWCNQCLAKVAEPPKTEENITENQEGAAESGTEM